MILIKLSLCPSSHAINPACTGQKSLLATFERDLASKKKEEGAVLKAESAELKELRKQVATLTASYIAEKCMVQEHQCNMELNKQRNMMNVMSHAAKLGNVAQTKAESLAQS
jgi:hypothetical protein